MNDENTGAGGSDGTNNGLPTYVPTEPSEGTTLGLEKLREDVKEKEDQRAAAVARAERAEASLGKYFLTLKCGLEPVSNRDTVGFDVPEGIRLHVNYAPNQDQNVFEVTSDPNEPLSAVGADDDWAGITGKIASGGDWVLIQQDGVARFDTRVTIKTDDHVLIDAVFIGAVDLAAAVPQVRAAAKDLGAEVYAAYLNGKPEITELPVTLSVRFEAAEQPYLRPGEDGSWIEKSRYNRNKRNFPRYRSLVRSLFVARGTITLDPKPRWPPTKISLKIYNQV